MGKLTSAVDTDTSAQWLFLFVSQAQATCLGFSQIVATIPTRHIYNSRIHRPPPITSYQTSIWLDADAIQRKLNSLTITQGYTAAGSVGKLTVGYRNGDYRIIGADPRGPVQRTCINRKCLAYLNTLILRVRAARVIGWLDNLSHCILVETEQLLEIPWRSK